MGLTIGPALLLPFSEKISSYGLVDMGGVDAHVQPDLAATGLDDVDVCTVQGSDAAQGKFAILLGLTLD